MDASNRIIEGNWCALTVIVTSCLLASATYAGTVVPNPVRPDPSGIKKNRYLSIVVPDAGSGQEAILVTVAHLPDFPEYDGLQLWAGPTWQAPDENSGNPSATVTVAPLQCEPYFTTWSVGVPIHLYAGEIQPEGVYTVQRVDISCTDLSDPTCYSAPITVHGAKFGDIVEPFEGPGVASQPDALDMVAAVLKFLAAPSSPSKTQAQLLPDTVWPDRPVDLRDLGALFIGAIQGESFGENVSWRPPCGCPSTFPCGIIPCTTDANCYNGTYGVCLDGFCADRCLRCSPDTSVCGDGIVGVDEQCDDGGTTPGDGCNQFCQFEYVCGNGIVEPGEACDDGNAAPGDGCDEFCQLEGLCGNGTMDAGELCDDGNKLDGDGCDSLCRIEPECGNGIVEHLEECDGGSGCSADCTFLNRSAVMEVVPVLPYNGTSYPTDVAIDGNQIFLTEGSVRLWFELRLSGWGTDGLVAWQATLDSAGFHNGSDVSVEFAQEPCIAGAYHCEDTFDGYARCIDRQCVGGENDGRGCPDSSSSSSCPGGTCTGVCSPAYYDGSRYSEFYSFTEPNDSGNRARLSFAYFGYDVADPGTTVYGGTIVIDVPPGATGSYTVGFDRRLDATFMQVGDGNAQRFAPIAEFRPATITIDTGCCLGYSCSDLGPASCFAAGGTPVSACIGDCNHNGRDDACDLVVGGAPDCNNNQIPDECETDCNGNGSPDDCDVSGGTSNDCNGNGIPDECENDCNDSGLPDDCDVALGLSQDCNGNGVPDECDPNEDCNSNSAQDICDIAAGTSEDCNGNLVPDECEPGGTEDCNNNGVSDLCDLFTGTAFDCNENGVPDSCDIANGTSLDDNSDGLPDECCVPPAAPLAEVQPIAKNRYLTMRPDPSWAGRQIALRVNPLTLPGLEYAEYVPLWVGPLGDYPDENAAHPGQTFSVARLQCDPYYTDWSGESEFHVTGAQIIPWGRYKVQAVEAGCDLSFASSYSEPLRFTNAKFGDIVAPFDGQGPTEPDFTDITALIDKFLAAPTAPPKARAQLQPSVIRPNRPVDFGDIYVVIQAFLGERYVDTFTGYGGRPEGCTCPSAVTCGATACLGDGQCTGGVCLDGFCMDACGWCTP